MKSVAFLATKPAIPGFAEQQPYYDPQRIKTCRKDLDALNEWTKRIEKVGHPGLASMEVTMKGPHYAVPYATWTSPFSCELQRSRDVWETILTNQMDPGRLLHAFVCRGSLSLNDDQLLVLAPGSPAETLACWLAGLSGTSHVIVKWSDLDTTKFEQKCGKALLKRLGQYPLPTNFVIRDTAAAYRPSLNTVTTISPTLDSVHPPPYFSDRSRGLEPANETGSTQAFQAVELPTVRDAVELPSTTVAVAPRHMHPTFPPTKAKVEQMPSTKMTSSTALGTLTSVHRKPAPATRHLSMLMSTPALSSLPARSASNGAAIPAILKPGLSAVPPSTVAVPRGYFASSTAPPYPLSIGEREAHEVTESHKSSSRAGGQVLEAHTTAVELPIQIDSHELVLLGDTAYVDSSKNISPAITLSQPSVSDTRLEGTESEAAHEIDKSDQNSKDTYLQLLNRVALGELSPQALSQILQSTAW